MSLTFLFVNPRLAGLGAYCGVCLPMYLFECRPAFEKKPWVRESSKLKTVARRHKGYIARQHHARLFKEGHRSIRIITKITMCDNNLQMTSDKAVVKVAGGLCRRVLGGRRWMPLGKTTRREWNHHTRFSSSMSTTALSANYCGYSILLRSSPPCSS